MRSLLCGVCLRLPTRISPQLRWSIKWMTGYGFVTRSMILVLPPSLHLGGRDPLSWSSVSIKMSTGYELALWCRASVPRLSNTRLMACALSWAIEENATRVSDSVERCWFLCLSFVISCLCVSSGVFWPAVLFPFLMLSSLPLFSPSEPFDTRNDSLRFFTILE